MIVLIAVVLVANVTLDSYHRLQPDLTVTTDGGLRGWEYCLETNLKKQYIFLYYFRDPPTPERKIASTDCAVIIANYSGQISCTAHSRCLTTITKLKDLPNSRLNKGISSDTNARKP